MCRRLLHHLHQVHVPISRISRTMTEQVKLDIIMSIREKKTVYILLLTTLTIFSNHCYSELYLQQQNMHEIQMSWNYPLLMQEKKLVLLNLLLKGILTHNPAIQHWYCHQQSRTL